MDNCIYLKVSGSKYIFLVLYVDDILFEFNDLGLLHDTKQFYSQNFEMKDMGEASYVIGVEIHRDRSKRTLGLSHKAYIERVLEKFKMSDCTPNADKFSLSQCPKNDLKKEQMVSIPYASVVGS